MSFPLYLLGHSLSLLALYGFWSGGLSSFLLPFVVFGLVPILELFMTPKAENLSNEKLDELNETSWYNNLVLAVIPLQYMTLLIYLWFVRYGSWTIFEWIGCTLSMGILCGLYGINAAHELGHRSDRFSKWGAKALLLTSLYMHFFIEHNRGHHAKVATEDDPASSRLNETLYTFWYRSVRGSFLSAWRIETRRLERKSLSPWSWQNQALRFIVIQLSFLFILWFIFGNVGILSFVCVATLGFSLLEAVNYIEHYGLQRQKNSKGRYEPVTPAHSWNADYPISRILLFELSRHADHHAHPRRGYAQLRHFSESYQLPTGYPGMILLALVPFIYIPTMNNQIHLEAKRVASTMQEGVFPNA
jgi:alkane 1-monooxygenase